MSANDAMGVSMKYSEIPAGGCELRDVAFHDLEKETIGGGWIVVSSYLAKWTSDNTYSPKEGEGMRYLIARVNEAPEIAKHIKNYTEANSARWKAESDKKTAEDELKRVHTHNGDLYRQIAALEEEKLLRDRCAGPEPVVAPEAAPAEPEETYSDDDGRPF